MKKAGTNLQKARLTTVLSQSWLARRSCVPVRTPLTRPRRVVRLTYREFVFPLPGTFFLQFFLFFSIPGNTGRLRRPFLVFIFILPAAKS